MKQIENFRQKLKAFNLTIKSLKDIEQTFVKDLDFHVKGFIFLSFFLIPFLMFFIPLKVILSKIVPSKRASALKASQVKIKGNDVVQTINVTYSLVLLPILVNIYGAFFFYFTYIYLELSLAFAIRLQIDFLFWGTVYFYFSVTMFDQ